jgi:GNAT superfamily N-acetyltransferase
MLILFTSTNTLDFTQFMEVCRQSNLQKGSRDYPSYSQYDQVRLAESELCDYIRDGFRSGSVICAAWAPEGRYKAVLRLEKYMDGYLICGLETLLQERRKGYARSLITAVLESFPNSSFYAHIYSQNIASVQTHVRCGFQRLLDHAVFLDGSVSTKAFTYYTKA